FPRLASLCNLPSFPTRRSSDLEVITLPVSDVERALRFYIDQVGFTLDVDYSPNDAFRVVQLTPPGSSCSIQIGNGLTDAPVGSLDRKSTRLNSSHRTISYAVFC